MGAFFAKLPLLASDLERRLSQNQPTGSATPPGIGNLEMQDLRRAQSLLSLDYSGPGVCGGSPCMTDKDIDAPLEKSRAEDRAAEARATDQRMARYMVEKALEADVENKQRGTREHRYALERLHTFQETGQLTRPRVNMEGAPGPENITLGSMALGAPIAAAFPIASTVVAGLTIGTSIGEAFTGRSSGLMNPTRLLGGDFEIGRKLSTTERFAAGLTALVGILTAVLGPRLMGGNPKLASPVFRYADRDIVLVETSAGRQAFYRSTGDNSGMAGKWLPVDEVLNLPGIKDWFNKAQYTEDFPVGDPLHRLGSPEFAQISEALTEMNLPQGGQLMSGKHVNDILDFFGARLTQYNQARPGLE